MTDDLWFQRIAGIVGSDTVERAPARLKSRIYSAVVARLSEQGPLLDLKQTKRAECGRLCVFENILTIAPTRSGIPAMNPCRICHARILGEHMDHAPIFWPGCPYSEFHQS
jgi:hypothetical protein